MTSVCQLFIYNSLKFVATLFKILICESNCLFMKKVNKIFVFFMIQLYEEMNKAYCTL